MDISQRVVNTTNQNFVFLAINLNKGRRQRVVQSTLQILQHVVKVPQRVVEISQRVVTIRYDPLFIFTATNHNQALMMHV